MTKSASKTDEPQKFLASLRHLIGPEEILEAGCRLGALQRQRKVELPALVEATILSILPTPGVQTTAMANDVSLTGEVLAPSSFYDRFSPEFALLMREVMMRAIQGVREATPASRRRSDFGVLLKEFSDVQVADSTSLLLKTLARHWAPSTSKERPAGVKWHAIMSLKVGVPVAERLTE
jgi:hypothetical protein